MTPRLPIIQGGMAVKVSLSRLASAVANAGGIGIIAGTGLTREELATEIQKAKALTKGYIGVNVLFAAREFADLIKTAIAEKVDFIISGAGFSRDMFSLGREGNIPIISIVSSARVAKMAQKLGAAAVVVEGKEAGGHLGTDKSVLEILPEVVGEVDIPVIAAGGIIDGYDVARMIELGADGVQMATRFVASEECDINDNFKQRYLSATSEDVVLIDSPVGLPGRALANEFTRSIQGDTFLPIESCNGCLKHCTRKFCILEALRRAARGDTVGGLIFSGEFVGRIREILPVQTIMDNIAHQFTLATCTAQKA